MTQSAELIKEARRRFAEQATGTLLPPGCDLLLMIALASALEAQEGLARLSWNGFNISGDRKSIDEVLRLVQTDGTNEALRERICGLASALEASEAARDASDKALLAWVDCFGADTWKGMTCIQEQRKWHRDTIAAARARQTKEQG